MERRATTTRFIIGAVSFCLILFAGLDTSAADRDWGHLVNGDMYFFYCSHQDLGWEGSYHDCKEKRSRNMIEPVVGWAKDHSNYKYWARQENLWVNSGSGSSPIVRNSAILRTS